MSAAQPGREAWLDLVPAIVDAAVRRCRVQQGAVSGWRPSTDADRAVRADRLAVLAEREARWWSVLERWVVGRLDVPMVFALSAIEVAGAQREHARFWRDMAADWRRRAAGEPVCSVIGCSCGGTCEVPG